MLPKYTPTMHTPNAISGDLGCPFAIASSETRTGTIIGAPRQRTREKRPTFIWMLPVCCQASAAAKVAREGGVLERPRRRRGSL